MNHPYEQQFKDALEKWRALSLEERLTRLKEIGILDSEGNLHSHYRRGEEE